MNIPCMAMAAVASLAATAAMSDSARLGTSGELALHSATPNVLWQSVREVFEGACEFFGANCRTSFVQSEGFGDGWSADMGAVPSIAFENGFDGAVAQPAEIGVGAVSANPDDGEGAEDDARQESGFQVFDMAASAVGEANSWKLPMEGSVEQVADIPMAGRSCSMPRAAGDVALFEEVGGTVEAVADANLLPPDTRARVNSVGQLQVVAGACAMRIDP